MPVLLIEKGPSKGQRVTVRPGASVVIGRGADVGLRVDDPLVSDRQCLVREADGAWWITDAGSHNGTWLNGEPVEEETALRPGDQIEIGETVLSFTPDADSKRVADPMVGQTVGGYRIIERVGRGGMGVVYKATQLSLNREVALKILAKKYAEDKTFIQMFVEEARAAAAMNHPNIVQAYDVGKAKDTYYFSMEFMSGGSVQDVLAREGRIVPGRALAMMIGAARGLEFAEKKHIVHCDIKPDNLMLTDDGTVKIGDLGLSKNLKKGGGGGDDKVFGTPHFVAPEQIQGRPLDHRTALYSLGASFFRMVSGRTPFTGETARELVTKHLKEPVPPLKSVDPDLPKALDDIVQRLMQKEPGARYQSATDLVNDCRHAMAEVGAEGGYTDLLPGVGGGGGRRGKRGVLVTVAVAVLAIAGAVVAVAVGGGNGGLTPEQIEEQARQRREMAEKAAAVARDGAAGGAFSDLLQLENRLKDPAHPDLEKALREFIAEFPDHRLTKDVKAKLDAIPGLRAKKDADEITRKWQALQRQFEGRDLTDPTALAAIQKFVAEAEKVAATHAIEIPELAEAKKRLADAAAATETAAQRETDATTALTAARTAAGPLMQDERFGDAKKEIDKFDLKQWEGTKAAGEHPALVKAWEGALGAALKRRGEEAKALEGKDDLDGAIAVWTLVKDRFGVPDPVRMAEGEIARLTAEKARRAEAALQAKIKAERAILAKADDEAKPFLDAYQFAQVLVIYRNLRSEGRITTEPVKAELEARERDFQHAAEAKQALIAACNKSQGADVVLPTGLQYQSPKIESADDGGLKISISAAGRRVSTEVPWTKYSPPAELHALFHRQVPGSPRAALQRAALALVWGLLADVTSALDEAERAPQGDIQAEVRYYRGRLAALTPPPDAGAAGAKLRERAVELMRRADAEPDSVKARGLLEEALRLLTELATKFPDSRAAKGK